MTATADAVLDAARNQLGFYAKPGTSTPFGQWYADQVGDSVFVTGQWCAMFVSWCAAQVGALDIIPLHAYTPSGANWFKRQGRWHDGKAGARPGDLIYFRWPNGPARISHVGIVEAVLADGRLQTIEGNTAATAGGDQRNSGCCARKIRSTSIVGFGRPAYAAAASSQSGRLAVDGWWGAATTRALQAVFGTPVDGIVSSQSAYRKLRVKAATSGWEWTTRPRGSRLIAAMQAWLGVDADGIVGPDTINALTARMGLVPDGVLDGPSNTVRVMQRRLNAGTFRS